MQQLKKSQRLTGGGGDYNILLVVGAKKSGIFDTNKISSVIRYADKNNLPEEKILGDSIVCIPGFTLEKYRRLQRSQLSIFSSHCFGGLISNMLGLPFRSPLGTNGVEPYGFIRFLREPHRYLEEKFALSKFELVTKVDNERQKVKLAENDEQLGRLILNFEEDPFKTWNNSIVKLGDISMSIVHYRTFEGFVEMWERRKKRINWDNVFVEMYTADPKILEMFDVLPYDKKVCFVPFKSDLDSAWYINPEIDKHEQITNFHGTVIRFGRGVFFYYDLFDMLLYGKKTPLIEM